MPSINRIRVNNVKYNFGTQQYDDFTMRMYGKNTLYDLANGGGKSILMLLLLQNLIPNCTLDEKQPIEKLFRAGCGNTTIHSLIEWKLDEPDIRDGYRYMTTGFCARKAKDSPDDEEGGKDVAAIEYFNYCIFYRDYNDHDIINLPLTKDGERVSYTGWKNYLKELGRRDMKLEVQVFERKGEYQRFISQYGLYESHWEIIRGINKTEGHVRTYFESNYRTARKVVEDLLIEEIIEKAYLVKIDKNDGSDDMAHTLMEIKDKLIELSKKKREIADYDRQTELLHVLEARVATFLELYENQDKQCSNIANVCVTGATVAKKSEDRMKGLEKEKEEQQKQVAEQQLLLERLKIKKDTIRKEALEEEIRRLQAEIRQQEEEARQCQEELNRKESMNDYLDYRKSYAEKEENEAVIEASLHQNGDQLEKLQAMSRERKHRDDQALQSLREELEQERRKYRQAEEELHRQEHLLQETETAQAVAKHDREQLKQQYEQTLSEYQTLRTQLSEAGFQQPEELLKQQADRRERQRQELDELETETEQLRQAYYKEKQLCEQLEEQLSRKEAELLDLETNDRSYREQTETLRRMLEIYGETQENKSTEWLNNEDISVLLQKIHQRYLENIAMISARKDAVEKKRKRQKELEEGLLIAPTEAAQKVKYYIESRHGIRAIFGMDYIAAQSQEQRARILEKHPLLPYGLIVEDFEALDTDRKLRELNLGDECLPVYNQSVLGETVTETESGSVMYLQRGTAAFVGEEELEKEKQQQEKELEELIAEVERLEEMGTTYQEDSAFVAAFQGKAILDVEQELLDTKEAVRSLREQLTNSREEVQRLEEQLKENRKAGKEKQQKLYQWMEEQAHLELMQVLSRQLEEQEVRKRENQAECDRLHDCEQKYQQACSQSRRLVADSKNRVEMLDDRLQHRMESWNTYYKDYYIEETEAGYQPDQRLRKLSDSELDAEYKAVKAVFEKNTVVLEDKRRLIEALKDAMDRSVKAIRKRGSSLQELEVLWQEHKLYAVPEQDLELLSTEYSRLSLTADTAKHHMDGRLQKLNRLEGSMEQAIHVLEERFGSYEEIPVAEDDIEERLQAEEQRLQHLNQACRESEQAYQKYSRDYTVMLDLYKDVKRIVETNDISLQDAKVLLIDKEQLREVFETSLVAYDKSTKALDRARGELQRYKNQTAQALTEMQAYELSQTVNNDVTVPGNLGEARELRDNLASIIQVIALEKSRVEQGITDMQFIKENFEKQCIQRCQDVKNELEKLPKLSRIVLDGESIQMVGLTIPYVKEEFIAKRMADYIDDVVTGADRYQNQNERMKYIRTRLELKRLFSVIVTDMNNIRLTLYKRERMKEQSRYLRYEEAVGSTGQSQGIYIQFLISVINYISGIYSANSETDKLMKTIFIDNPFGAAKDVYIWEPIFALLKANHVQLIVPARGATPAITSRFDVNYILGQQMVGKRQQTVVVDYRSQVEQEELEYRNLEYEQVSFDFI